jgi:hypothetical protein
MVILRKPHGGLAHARGEEKIVASEAQHDSQR